MKLTRAGLAAVVVTAAGAGAGLWLVPVHWLPDTTTRVPPRSATAAAIVAGAKQQQGTLYDARYITISYPNGDVAPTRGACTDVVIRSLRHAGYDLQQLLHTDIAVHWNLYPHQWAAHPDPSIDHRRAPNQIVFFRRHALTLTTAVTPQTLPRWQPGDIVYWQRGNGLYHTGVLSDGINSRGVPLVIHNSRICVEADCLTHLKIAAHFRYPTHAAHHALKARVAAVPQGAG